MMVKGGFTENDTNGTCAVHAAVPAGWQKGRAAGSELEAACPRSSVLLSKARAFPILNEKWSKNMSSAACCVRVPCSLQLHGAWLSKRLLFFSPSSRE